MRWGRARPRPGLRPRRRLKASFGLVDVGGSACDEFFKVGTATIERDRLARIDEFRPRGRANFNCSHGSGCAGPFDRCLDFPDEFERGASGGRSKMNFVTYRLRQIALFGGFVLAFLLCVGGSLTALPLLAFPASRQRERWGRWIVFVVSRIHTRYLSFFGAVRSDLEKLAPLRKARGLIIAANHPTLLDAIMLFSELPQTFCLVKAEVMRNPLLALLAKV